ncbi:MAG: IclR family transcriptional regulator [Nitrospirae bacterium GWD2_57_9]|nr:MAG: IclR family transcriptional regulator [Nitrospirae bacterium GWD2_57_9]OGW48911.1 MAG: IclR family transcriptional regulator [Nitrospirae bacterium GWC2_57_9]
MVTKREKVNYTIQSVSHALDILESFTKTEDELGVTELSKRLGLHKNNVFRLLATLEHRGYIEQNKTTENYRLGAKTLQIGSIFIEQRECRRQARPIIEKLMSLSGETAVVAVLRGNKVIYMDSVETNRTVRAVSRIGAMLPAHCTAVGKAHLAVLPSSEIERLYPEPSLPALTEKSIKTRELLMADLKRTVERGYAVENEECDLEVGSIAVPVKDFSRNIIAAVAIVAPVARLLDERLEKGGLISQIQDAGRALSAKLGYIAPSGKK